MAMYGTQVFIINNLQENVTFRKFYLEIRGNKYRRSDGFLIYFQRLYTNISLNIFEMVKSKVVL